MPNHASKTLVGLIGTCFFQDNQIYDYQWCMTTMIYAMLFSMHEHSVFETWI